MTHSNLVLVSTALLVMGAGVMVGRLSTQLEARIVPAEPATRPEFSRPQRQGNSTRGSPPSWLADQLNLTAEQRQKMDLVWADTQKQIDKMFQSRPELERAREQAIHDLLTEDQRKAYDKINEDFRNKRDDSFKARTKLVQDASDQSRALLDDIQKAKYDLLAQQMERRSSGRGGAGFGPGSRGGQPGGRDRDHARGERGPGQQQPTTKPMGGAEGFRAGTET